jgi:hypothetical protein
MWFGHGAYGLGAVLTAWVRLGCTQLGYGIFRTWTAIECGLYRTWAELGCVFSVFQLAGSHLGYGPKYRSPPSGTPLELQCRLCHMGL